MSNPLSEQEFELLSDPTLLPDKYRICEKIDQWLSELRIELESYLKLGSGLPREILKNHGKISRGENYHFQAYRVLDYPRLFRQDAIFAFRTVVLWGHPIGFHIILSGTYKELFQDAIGKQRINLGSNWLLAAQESPWIWEANAPGLSVCKELSEEQWAAHVATYQFLKISSFLPLSSYRELVSTGLEYWQMWESLLEIGSESLS